MPPVFRGGRWKFHRWRQWRRGDSTPTPTSTVTNKATFTFTSTLGTSTGDTGCLDREAPGAGQSSLGPQGLGQGWGKHFYMTHRDRYRVTPSVQTHQHMGTPSHTQMHSLTHKYTEMRDAHIKITNTVLHVLLTHKLRDRALPGHLQRAHTFTGAHLYQAGQALALLSHPRAAPPNAAGATCPPQSGRGRGLPRFSA